MPLNASALVIGVDVYDRADIPRLTGCAADACAAANWLVRIGVPADNIFLHLSQPVGATRPRTPVAVLEADMDSLNRSMQALQKRGGDQLFVLMSGHGLYVPVEGPIFLPSNYASPSTRTNLKINEYIRWFQSWPYRDQFLFYDACQNPTAAIGQVSAVQATGPDPDPATYRPLDGNGLIACYAVSPGQEAWAGDGSGVLTSQVIGELDPAHWASLSADAEQQDAILYDWTTGERRVDLKDLFNSIIKPAIEAQVTAAGHIGQTPYCQLNGRAQVEDQAPILTLPPEPCSQVSISVQPPEAAGAVDQLRLTIPTPSRRHYLRAPPETFAAPIMRLAPAGAVLEARCRERPGSGWRSRNSPLQEVLSHPAHALVFAGIPHALVTSSARQIMDAALDVTGMRFPVTVCSEDVRRTKPHPEPYLLAAARLGVPPPGCVVLEDSPNGVAAARAAGCPVIAVPSVPIPPGPGYVTVKSLTVVDLATLAGVAASNSAGSGHAVTEEF